MPSARFLAPWQREERREALRDYATMQGLGREELAGLMNQPAIYHCVSRVVDRRFVFGDREKEKFVALMRCHEEFSQVQVLAFCVMSNHFHILVEVPTPPPERGRDWTDEEFLEHLSCLYSEQALAEIRWQLELLRTQNAAAAAKEYRDRFFARMWDLSAFMKELKQAFSRWFNRVHDRRGTLWEERFKSVLAEDGPATRVMSAYIDLNPVRAGMVTDPKNYRWSSYGEAVAGKQRARQGIERVMLGTRDPRSEDPSSQGYAGAGMDDPQAVPGWRAVVRSYREVLYAPLEKDQARQSTTDGSRSETEVLSGPVRQFTDGVAVGLPPFLELVFEVARNHFGPRRRDGARKMRGIHTELRAMRDLQPSGR